MMGETPTLLDALERANLFQSENAVILSITDLEFNVSLYASTYTLMIWMCCNGYFETITQKFKLK
jgi:hypothetical protein